MHTGITEHRDRTLHIRSIGGLLLAAGSAVGLLGPLEMYCFYLFGDGGRFHYEGFGVGSFMFFIIAGQIVGYYIIAAFLIPLGYGHLTLRRWARTLTLACLWTWLVIGIPISTISFFVMAGSKELSPLSGILFAVFLAASYGVFPWLFIRFYRSHHVRLTFQSADPRVYRIEQVPLPLLVMSIVFLFLITMLHMGIILRGIVPVFGSFLYGFQGIVIHDLLIACLICLIWGVLRQRRWAWWGSVAVLGLMTSSTILSLLLVDFQTIIAGLQFPAREMAFLGRSPLKSEWFAVLIGIPLLITWCITLLSKPYFQHAHHDRYHQKSRTTVPNER